MPFAEVLESITLPNGTTQELGPTTDDGFAIFEDLCLLVKESTHNSFNSRPLSFALELIESVLTNYHQLFHKVCLSFPVPFTYLRPVCQQLPSNDSHALKHSGLLLSLQHHHFSLLLKTLSERSAFPPVLCGTPAPVSSSSRSSNSPPSSRQRPMSSSRYSSNSLTGAEARPRWIGCSRWGPCAGKATLKSGTGLLVTTLSYVQLRKFGRVYTLRNSRHRTNFYTPLSSIPAASLLVQIWCLFSLFPFSLRLSSLPYKTYSPAMSCHRFRPR
jgi:hypothetical protein